MSAIMNESSADFAKLAIKFGRFHMVPANIFLHLITTPLGLIGFISLVMQIFGSTSFVVTLVTSYLFLLLPTLTIDNWLVTAATCAMIVAMSRWLKLRARVAVLLICSAYMFQDLAHWLSAEPTFQASYSNGGQIDFLNLEVWSQQFMEHCFFLLPLCVDSILPRDYSPPFVDMRILFPSWVSVFQDMFWLLAPLAFVTIGNYNLDSKNTFCFFPGYPYFCRVLSTNITGSADASSQKGHLSCIRSWALSQAPPPNTSTHFWYRDLPPQELAAFHAVTNCNQITNMFRKLFNEKHYYMETVDGMNEVYITGPSRNDEGMNSDRIFYTKHVDGPYGFIPFCSVYRCIVGMDKNYMTTTRFPMNPGIDIAACEGDVVAFDFNREVHYITRDESMRSDSDEFRVTLKLHYVMYPRVLIPLGKLMHFLNVKYNQTFRALFLKTLNPQTVYEHFLAWNVVVNTTLYNSLETYIGTRNILYLLSAFASAWMTGEYRIFLYATSFIHYFRYIGTYYFRKGIDYGSFKRDVLLFKNVALIQLFYLVFASVRASDGTETFALHDFISSCVRNIDLISVAMICFGYGVSIKATAALGLDRTYFGAELGHCEPKWVTLFPYGFIPHPMIVGQMIALIGIHRIACFSAVWPVLVPIHVLLYAVHMTQEHFEVHKGSSGK